MKKQYFLEEAKHPLSHAPSNGIYVAFPAIELNNTIH